MIFFSIYLLGHLITAFVCYIQPKVYESTGVFIERVEPDQSIPLPSGHAAMVVSALEFEKRWGIPFEDAVLRIQESVTIQTEADTTVIRAQFASAQDCRMVVESVMKNYPGFEREKQWAEVAGAGDRYTKKEHETCRTVMQLRKVIHETLQKTGNDAHGLLIGPDTVHEINNEDLSRQFGMLQEKTQELGRFGPPDGLFTTLLKVAAVPIEPQDAISPDIDRYFLVGRIATLVICGLALVSIHRWKPTLIQAPERKPAPTPAWAETNGSAKDLTSW